MKCVTGKVCFDSRELAEEALIENHARYYRGTNSGPINVYECRDCGQYHFTSKGEVSDVLNQKKGDINAQREANHWERKLR